MAGSMPRTSTSRPVADEVGTPFYCYSTATLERHYTLFAKAVGAPEAPRLLRYEGEQQPSGPADAGAARCRRRHGLGRRNPQGAGRRHSRRLRSCSPASASRDPELAFAVDAGIYQVNIETEGELHALSRIAAAKGRRQAAVFRINPDVGAGGHAKITTGSDANKFGVSLERGGARSTPLRPTSRASA